MHLTSSDIVCMAMGLKPEGALAPHEGTCSFCGKNIWPGDRYTKFSVGPSFMDVADLAAKGSGMTCGHCTPLMSSAMLRATANGIFSESGVQPFAKWVDVARGLLNPPEPPFVMLYATRKSQHMAWRARVNLSRDLFYVRVGLRDLKIRRPVLLSAVQACQTLGTFMGIKPTAKSLAHPFAVLSSDLKDPAHSLLRRKGPEKTLDEAAEAYPEAYQLIQSLTLGETWAMRFLLSPNAGAQATAQSEGALS
ncbi:MAG: type IV CRISPR-associated protein Csf1 [Planctomycetia bacterium]|nr:type IV CRISPR-associated protein Csf1 [Planctomycetia bacterium]